MLSPEEHQERTRQLTSPDADPRLSDTVAVAVASWLPAGSIHATVATTGNPRTGTFLYRDGLLVLRFEVGGSVIGTAVIRNRDIEAIEMSHTSQWYFDYQHGGVEQAATWAGDARPATATIRFRYPVLDIGNTLEFPLPGREWKYPGDWELVSFLRERLLGLHSAD